MGNEALKNIDRRKKNGDRERYFRGTGIDVGCGGCPLYNALTWDKRDGLDAHRLKGIETASIDWVHSSHCLEHLEEPVTALREWWRVLKPGGYLVVTVPHFGLYEHFRWPSTHNHDHKHWFTMESIQPLLKAALHDYQLLRLQLNDYGFDYKDKQSDQTRFPDRQAEIEFIVRKVVDPYWADDYNLPRQPIMGDINYRS